MAATNTTSARTVTPDKLQPHNIEAEEAVLGALLIDPDAIIRVITFLQPKDFFLQRHTWIYESIQALHERREPTDLITLTDELERRNQLDDAGGPTYLTDLINATPTSIHIEYYARIVERTAILRRLIDGATQIAQLAYQDVDEVEEIIDRAEAIIFGVSEQRTDRDLRPIRHAIDQYYDRIEYLSQHQGEIVGIPTGLKDLDKLLGGMQRSDLIILAGRPGMGKCVSADTKLIDPTTGDLISIETLVKQQQANLLTLNSNYKLQTAQASDFIDDGIKPVYQVTTALGREIKVTLSHPFLTIKGWTPLKNLNVGDFIAVPRIIPVFGNDDVSAYKVKVLAYLLADGCLTGTTPQFTNKNPKLHQDFIDSALQFSGVKTRLVDNKNGRVSTVHIAGDLAFIQSNRLQFAHRLQQAMQQEGYTQQKLAITTGVSTGLVTQWTLGKCAPSPVIFEKICDKLKTSTAQLVPTGLASIRKNGVNSLTTWLQNEDVWGKSAAEKEIPASVYRYTRPKLALFLNRLFACDGSVYIQQGKQGVISYTSVSLKLARGVQHLLLRFGIIAKLRHRQIKYKNHYRPAYQLRITGVLNLKQFVTEIGIYGKEEAIAKLQMYLTTTSPNPNTDIIPLSVWEQIKQAKGQKTWRSVYQKMGLPPTANIHVDKRKPSRARLLAIGQALQSSPLLNLAQSDIYWDKITAIKYLGQQQVYDLTVPENHNFVADDMIVHNTSLALSIALQSARKWNKRIAVFSLEMSDEQLVQRLLSAETGIDSQRLRLGQIRDDEWPVLIQATTLLADTSLFLDDTPAISVMELRTKSRRLEAEHGLDLIIVDYLQLMRGNLRSENRQQEISFISRSLKELARELKVPVLALSQLSRAVESRHDKRPMLSDLRESGSIEQDADVVMFVYRDEIYNPDTEFPNIAEIMVSKHRSGPTGIFSVYFKKQLAQFVDLEVKTQPLDY